MAIEFECPLCRERLHAGEGAAGSAVRCGTCQGTVRVPGPPRPAAELVGDTDPAGPRRRSRRPFRNRRVDHGKGRRVLVWAGGVTAVLLLLAVALVVHIRTPKWRVYESAGGFRVEFPGTVQYDRGDAAGATKRQYGETEGADILLRLEEYVVWHGKQFGSDHRGLSPADALRVEIELTTRKAVRVLRDEPVTVSGFPGRELEAEFEDNRFALIRVVAAETKQYVVVAAFQGGAVNERARRFVDSFQITDRDQLAFLKAREGREREQRERTKRGDDLAAALLEDAARQAHGDREPLAAGPPAGLTVPPPDSLPGVVLYESFDRPAGDPAPGRGVRYADGVRGRAAYLPARTAAAELTLPDPAGPPGAGGTLCGWVKVRHTPLVLLRVSDRTGRQLARVSADGRSVGALVHTATGHWLGTAEEWVRDSEWHHLAVTCSADGDAAVTLYLDGREVRTARASGPVRSSGAVRVVVGEAEAVPPNPAAVGLVRDAPADGPVAAVDEVAVFNRALSADEVLYLAGRETPESRARRLAAPPPGW